MRKILKVDLHTHCGEATGYVRPNIDLVARIIDAARAKGLDGMAITEHWSASFAKAFKTIMQEHFRDEDFLLITGRETQQGYGNHVVELNLPGNTTFSFLAHPKQKQLHMFDGIKGVEIENGMNGVQDKKGVADFAKANNLVLLRNSDAHRMADIGCFYNELVIDTCSGEWFLEGVDGHLVRIA